MMMPSAPVEILLRTIVPSVTPFHGRSCSHRLKQRLEKSDRRVSAMSVYARSHCAELFSGAEKGLHDFHSSLNLKQASDLVRQSLVTEVGHALDYNSRIPGAREVNYASDENGTSDSDEIITSDEPDNFAKNCLSKSPTSPEEVGGLNEDFKTVLNGVFSEGSNSLPLLSAMKGSREKSGASPRKLTVKWAPDVYDPTPTIVSHTVVRGKKQHKPRKDKKHWKDKKKGGGNSSRGTSGKDKKHRKTAGSPNKGYKTNENHDSDDDGFD